MAGEAILTSVGRQRIRRPVDSRVCTQDPRETQLAALPVLAVTGMRCRGPEQILSSGFDGYLSKPIDPKLLYRELDRLLSKDASSTDRADAAGKGG